MRRKTWKAYNEGIVEGVVSKSSEMHGPLDPGASRLTASNTHVLVNFYSDLHFLIIEISAHHRWFSLRLSRGYVYVVILFLFYHLLLPVSPSL